MNLRIIFKLTAACIALCSTGFLLWKCQFGVDLTDESFYAMPAWKLFALGDQPFRDEVFNAPRQNDWLNAQTIARVVPYSILKIRQSAVLFYALSLLAFLTLFFTRRLTIGFALCFASCLFFDINFMPTWSYNWWVRNSLLLHHALLLMAFHFSETRSRPLFFLSGAALGIGWLAYNSVVPFHLVIFIPFMIWFARHRAKDCALYTLGGVAAILPFALDFLLQHRLADFKLALHTMSSLGDYNSSFSTAKLQMLVGFFTSYPIFWFLGAYVVTLTYFKRLHFLVCAAFGVYLLRKMTYAHSHYFVLHAFISVGFWGGLYALWKTKSQEKRYLLGLAFFTVIIVGLSSVARMWAMAWATPVLWGAFLWQLELEKPAWFSRVVYTLLFLFVAKDTFLLQKNFTSTFYDVPIAKADTTMEVPPLQGLRTSGRRAYLVNRLSSLVADKKFVLAMGDLPGAVLFGNVRSAIDTTFTDLEAPPALIEASLKFMIEQKRVPELFVIAKEHAWTWGMPFPPTPPFTRTPYREIVKQSRFAEYAQCARATQVLDEPELEVWTVNASRLESCLRPELLFARN